MSNLSVSSTAKIKYRKPLKKHRKVTCIIGGKCKNGVVLFADKKIRNPNTDALEYREKLFIFQKDYFYYPIVVGSSGQYRCMKNSKEMPSIH
jgi:20S proteasome alpha/beta subunit